MAILNKGTTYAEGSSVTANNLNQHVDNAEFVAGAGNTTDDSTLEVHADGYLKIKDGGITSEKLASDAISGNDTIVINNNNFTSNSINGDKLVNSSVTSTQIANGAITSSKLASGLTVTPSAHSHNNASSSIAGFMSSTDKTKLDGLSASSGGGSNQNTSGEVALGNATQQAGYSVTVDKNLFIDAEEYNTGHTDGSAFAINIDTDVREWPDGTQGNLGLYTSNGGTPSKTINGVSYASNNFATIKQAVYSLHPTINGFEGNPGVVQHELFANWSRFTGGDTFDALEYNFRFQKIVGAWPPFFYDNGLKFRFQAYQDTSSANIFYTSSVLPYSFQYTFGIPTRRWGRIFTGYAVDTSSDRDLKTDIEELDEVEKRVAVKAKGLIRKFKYKIAVESKKERAKTHFGIIAQDLEKAFIDEGLDPSKYGILKKYDVWVGKDEDGKLKQETKEFEGATKKEEMSVRYDELWAFIISTL
jgi:hypothetical protein